MEYTQTSKIGNGQFIKGDCLEVMKELPENHFILAFTSPPYMNAINYHEHIEKLHGQRMRWEREAISYEDYRIFLVDRFKALLQITKPGGHNVVNIAPVAWDGRRTALPFHLVNWLEEIGWRFKEDIIWEKPISRDKRSGVLMQHPYPGYYYPSLVAEYVFVFQKPAPTKKHNNIYWNRSSAEKAANEIDMSDYQGEKSKNVWKIRQLAPQQNLHPCPFPLELAERVIELYSYKGDPVIDIFAGSGQTNCAAEKLGRKHLGIETQQKYINYAVQQLNQILVQLELFDSNHA